MQFYFNHIYVKSGGSLFTLGKVPLTFETGSLPLGPPDTLMHCGHPSMAIAGPRAPQREESELIFLIVASPGPNAAIDTKQELNK